VFRACKIPISPVIRDAEKLDFEEGDAWEKCSAASWEKKEQHVVGDKWVPLPPSIMMHQRHKH